MKLQIKIALLLIVIFFMTVSFMVGAQFQKEKDIGEIKDVIKNEETCKGDLFAVEDVKSFLINELKNKDLLLNKEREYSKSTLLDYFKQIERTNSITTRCLSLLQETNLTISYCIL